MREIISAAVGQCGNQINLAFWNTLQKEHMLDTSGKYVGGKDNEHLIDKMGVYYQEVSEKRFVPRCAIIDLEPGVTDVIKNSPVGGLFKPDNFVVGASGAGNNWAKGHYTEGAELIDEVMDVVRKEMESSDCPQGLQLTQSLGGGTGSGLGTLTLLKMRDNYPDRITCTFSVYPSPKVSDVVVEPYNATLAIHQLLENSDETFVVDNEALYNISHNVLKQKQPRYIDLNWVISLVMSGITCSLRFPGILNGDLRKMGVNLVPFPRLHFFLMAQAPLYGPGEEHKVKLTVQELTDQMWSSRNFLANVKPEDGKYLCAALNYRGELSSQEVDEEVAKVQGKMSEDFVSWIPSNIKTGMVRIPPNGIEMSGTFVANTCAIRSVFQRISAQFARMYKRKAFLHWYKGEGMDEMEFQEADKNLRDLCTEYQDKNDAVVELDEEEDQIEDDEQEEEDEE